MQAIDVVILTPTPEEWVAMKIQITSNEIIESSTIPAVRGVIGTLSVLIVQSGKGELNTAAALQSVLSEWSTRVVLLVGIAGGFAEQKIHRGDVVIATTIHHFDYGKISDGKFRPRPEDDFKCDVALLRRAQTAAVEHGHEFRNDLPPRPDGASSADVSIHRDCYIASSSKVLDDPSYVFFQDVKRYFPEIHAVEMEGSGAAAAIWLEQSRRQISFLMIRGISDQPSLDPVGVSTGTSQRKEWRAFAAASAAVFVSTFLKHGLSSFLSERSSGKTSRDQAREDISAKQLSKPYCSKLLRNGTSRLLRLIPEYNALFQFLVDNRNTTPSNLIPHLAQHIRDSRHPYPLRLDGQSGVGKTTLLSLLYVYLLEQFENNNSPLIPVYINVRQYDRLIRQEETQFGLRARQALHRDLTAFIDLSRSQIDREFICLIDGIDEYSRMREAIEDELGTLLQQVQHKKVVGLGIIEGSDSERFRRNIVDFSEPEKWIVLRPPGPTDWEDFLKTFVKVESRDGLPNQQETNRIQEILQIVRRFKMKKLDLFSVSLFARKSELCRNAKSFSGFLRLYCEDLLRKELTWRKSQCPSLPEVCSFAFRYLIRREEFTPEQLAREPGWSLLSAHDTIRDFLVANHVVYTLRKLPNGRERAKEDLQYVFPEHLSYYSKEIANESVSSQRDVIRGAREVFDRVPAHQLSSHVCYLLGRLTEEESRTQAITLLNQWKNRAIKSLTARLPRNTHRHSKSGKTSTREVDALKRPQYLLLIRTLYISLAYLRAQGASEEYISYLLTMHDWDSLNRGFHLEYYNDIPYVPSDKMSHSDALGPFPNTFRSLYERITRDIDNPDYGLRDIELYTLVSLAQHRHAEGRLQNDDRDRIALCVEDVLGRSVIKFQPLVQYLRMMLNNLKAPRFYPGQVAELMLRLKTIKRAGWVRRGIKDGESVADHTWGAYMIGLIFLPESDGCDKQRTLEMILTHDLGEVITGDYLPAERNDEARRREQRAYEYFGALTTYSGVFGLEKVRLLWEEFEGQATHSAKVARDLDKIENLFQLFLYKRQGKVIDDFEHWRSGLKQDLVTDEGRTIATTIESYFELSQNRRSEASA